MTLQQSSAVHIQALVSAEPNYSGMAISIPKMQTIYEASGAYTAKKHITYRYVFDNPGVVQKPKELIERNRKE